MRASAEPKTATGLEVRGMRCERGGRALFEALDFSVPAAGAMIVVGPNGSGKTTLLRALAGMTEASVRHIAWNGQPVSVRSAGWRSQLVYVGHKSGHKDELTAAENLELACALDGAGASAADRSGVLGEVGLATRSALPVKRLSQGQKQRLTLARLALSMRPLWLLDEPAAALDADARVLLAAIIGRHLARGGVAVIATHDAIEIESAQGAPLRLDLRVAGKAGGSDVTVSERAHVTQ